MLGELGGEFGPAAGILVLELHPGRPERVAFGRFRHALRRDRCGRALDLLLELRALAGLGAVAAAGDDQRQGALGIVQAEMQRREAAHR